MNTKHTLDELQKMSDKDIIVIIGRKGYTLKKRYLTHFCIGNTSMSQAGHSSTDTTKGYDLRGRKAQAKIAKRCAIPL